DSVHQAEDQSHHDEGADPLVVDPLDRPGRDPKRDGVDHDPDDQSYQHVYLSGRPERPSRMLAMLVHDPRGVRLGSSIQVRIAARSLPAIIVTPRPNHPRLLPAWRTAVRGAPGGRLFSTAASDRMRLPP